MDELQIIDLLWERNENVLAEVSMQYGRLYRDVLRHVLFNEEDVQECSNDVLMALWNSIPPNRPQHLTSYICTLARRIGIDKLRYNTRLRRNPEYTVMLSELEGCLPDPHSLLDGYSNRELQALLSAFICSLEPRTQVFFIRRYIYLETIPELATRFKLRENYISVRLHRARKQLRAILAKEGIIV